MTPIQVLIVDDEPLARSGLKKLCERDSDLKLVGECANGVASVEAILQVEPDLVLLDIQMPEMDGFEVLSSVGVEKMPFVIFVTAYDQFAVKAFEVHALDYLLKPFDDDRFFEAINRAKEAIRESNKRDLSNRLMGLLEESGLSKPSSEVNQDTASAPGFLTRIVVKEMGTIHLVGVNEIHWIEAANYCVKLHTKQKTHLIRDSLKSLDTQLDPAAFFRVSRSAIVNLDFIREIQPYCRGSMMIVLKDGTQVTLSRSRRDALERILGQSL